ncbi:MAG: 16S rRNA (adenine(1518)-N(6)/adenine(1519)-N(6))-dimethyltransferase RsmA [Candidatus Heteroscillospira sp.]|jgi:16S rRNA (adenine1518-N6/adenine1519-N6)-dimethyltransferase
MELTNLSVIKDVLGRNGFRFSKSKGQNFLTASWVPERIASECTADKDTAVLEIGPGIGCLTQQLSYAAGNVLSLEVDEALRPVLAETMAGCPNVEILFGDAMEQDLAKLLTERFGERRCVACANLPYNITTPVLSKLYGCEKLDTITVMIQREVARRLCAKPGTADYGAFTLFTQWYMEPEILFDVSPGCFIPQPKVTSSVIRLSRRSEPPARVKDEQLMFRLVRAAFNQRRKTLVNALQPALGGMSKAEIESCVASCGLDARVRGEVLGIPEFAALADVLSGSAFA